MAEEGATAPPPAPSGAEEAQQVEKQAAGGGGGGAAAAAEEEITPEEIIGRYKQMRDDIRKIAEKVANVDIDLNEHHLVINTITPMEKERKAFRSVGGLLTQTNVGTVLPSVKQQAEMLENLLKNLQTQLRSKEQEAAAWKTKYNIMTQQEREMMAQAQKAEQEQQKNKK
eukprot:CAMPEP_0118971730 /NCGR_PEP_ID=MMETSP1173-20130426/8266_1 /TAXON_ID=1034831 /ORGANISM="Rhizochromulina marina cf, Strain CCMP1243" /LENGTH=169 /DNA_ID=CAMNT_0006921209 /DNA_START=111 /DNA_END=620 /DNA_ORIENTATION=-